jgi:hypothetical protein
LRDGLLQDVDGVVVIAAADTPLLDQSYLREEGDGDQPHQDGYREARVPYDVSSHCSGLSLELVFFGLCR